MRLFCSTLYIEYPLSPGPLLANGNLFLQFKCFLFTFQQEKVKEKKSDKSGGGSGPSSSHKPGTPSAADSRDSADKDDDDDEIRRKKMERERRM